MSQECVYLGVSSQHRGFKCLRSNGKIYISKDDTFNEHHFPFPQLFSSNYQPKALSINKHNAYHTSALCVPTVTTQPNYTRAQFSNIIVPNSSSQSPGTHKVVTQFFF